MDGAGRWGIDLGEADEETLGWIETRGECSYYNPRGGLCGPHAKLPCLITQRSEPLKHDRTALASFVI
jgi:hypothetical protein